MKCLCLILCMLAVLAGHLPAQETKAQPVSYFNPDWSPDGAKIAFESTRDGKEVVYTIQVDGSGLRQLTSGESNPSGQPRWSSDGRQIVFISSREGREGLFLMNADGSQQRRLTNPTIGGDFVPVLSPKGDQVAFVSSEDEKTRTTDIYVIRTDGTGRRRLTNCDESVCGGAKWSPDGEKILFGKGLAMPKNFPSLSSEERTQVKARVKNSGDIFIMDKDGSHLRNLTNNNLANHHARWSKDGQTIYVLAQREGAPNVYAMNADGSNVRKVADGSPRGDASPDGKYLVYSKDVDSKSGIYIYDTETGKERLLVGGSGQQVTAPSAAPPLVFGGDPRVSPDGSRILFGSNRTGVNQLYVMNADGSNTRQITTGSSGAFSGRWSPDGKLIVYYTGAANVDQIVIVNADGTQRHVVSEAKGNQSPSWSPDGSKILFAAGEFPNINIYTMRVDGSDRRNIAPNEGFDYDPAWSPDGQTIALVTAIRGQGPRVWVMNADGSGRRRVTTSLDAEERPAWSPDGRYLAFQASKRGAGPHEAYVHVVEISNAEDSRLGTHNHAYLDETPSWFPDGKRIAFQSDRTGRMEVWVMNVDGMGQRQVIGAQQPAPKPVDNGGCPRVSPRGESMLFASNRDGTRRLYLMDAGGGAARALTAPGVKVSYGEWFSSGVEIAYVVPNGEATGIHILSLKTGVDSLVPNTDGAQGVSPSPDGRRLVFAGRVGKEIELHLINRDGSGDQVITSEPRFHSYPAWSPDGKEIAFTRGSGDGPKIFVMDVDGSNIRRVSALSVLEEVPAWSPDGRRLAFQGAVQDQHIAHLYIATVDGREVTQVTNQSEPYLTETPSWFPDGKRIAFQSDRTGRLEVWVMNADGTEQRQVTGAQPAPAALPLIVGGDPRVPPDGSPGPCGGHQLVYDDKLKMVVLVNCGETTPGLKGKLWGWTGSRWEVVSSDAPPTRVLGGAAYDSRRNMLMLYGGFAVVEGRPTPTAETWEWDGSRWTKRDVAPPDVTDHFAMTFDGARAKVVLHGGQGPDGVGKGDTWTWDGKKWEKASNTGPGPEAHHSLAYDSSKKKVLLFGGHQPQDLWEWDGTTWKDWENDKPRARSHACLAYDEKADQLVLFGGLGRRVWLGETLILKGSLWAARKGSGPSPRGLCAMAYDRARGVIVMYGGSQTPFVDNAAEQYSDETWEWDGNHWTQR